MKIIHIESGLGNQMLSYCQYLAIKKMNPDDDIYIETIVFDIPECNEVVNQWNGYELQKVFGIDAPNIKTIFSEEQWKGIIGEIRSKEFWNRGWHYKEDITNAFINAGLPLLPSKNEKHKIIIDQNPSVFERVKRWMGMNCLPYTYLREYLKQYKACEILRKANYDSLFLKTIDNIFIGQRLEFQNKNAGIERIEKDIKNAFRFPAFTDEKNQTIYDTIICQNAVAIHARRGDMLGRNYGMYKTGYFKRAVKYIRKHTADPVFYIFTDPGSIEWCIDNANILGLNSNRDEIYFVDWNKGEDSFRDIQLMAACKHQIITNSTFGWWGAYLNENPNKITCSPLAYINTTHTF